MSGAVLSSAQARALAALGIATYERRPPARRAAVPVGTAVTFVCSVADAGTDPATGPHAGLLRHLTLALGLAPARVAMATAAPAAGAVICFGGNAGESTDVLLAPPLATLRASTPARRALWQDLRQWRRRHASQASSP